MSEKTMTSTGQAVDGTPAPHGMISAEPLIPHSFIQTVIMQIVDYMAEFNHSIDLDTNLTGRERLRLFGAKSRNYGFISKSLDIARDNPAFRPPNFSMEKMEEHIRIFEEVRQLTIVLEQFQHAATDYLLMTADNAYRDALRVYGNLREQSRANVAGASALFDELLQYYTLHRRGRPGEEPTDKELDRDFHALIHGHKDGEMIIKNETPHLSGGAHTVVDDVHRGKTEFKGKVEGEIED